MDPTQAYQFETHHRCTSLQLHERRKTIWASYPLETLSLQNYWTVHKYSNWQKIDIAQLVVNFSRTVSRTMDMNQHFPKPFTIYKQSEPYFITTNLTCRVRHFLSYYTSMTGMYKACLARIPPAFTSPTVTKRRPPLSILSFSTLLRNWAIAARWAWQGRHAKKLSRCCSHHEAGFLAV